MTSHYLTFSFILYLYFFNSCPTSGTVWSKQNILPVCTPRSTPRCCILSCWSCPNTKGMEPYNNWKAFRFWFTLFWSVHSFYSFKIWGKAIIQVQIFVLCIRSGLVWMRLFSINPFPLTFRIDHLLGRNTIENLAVLRFSNLVFMPLWNRNYIDNVQVILQSN